MKKILSIVLILSVSLQIGAVMDPMRYEQLSNLIAQGNFQTGIAAIQKEIKKDKTEAAWYWMLDDVYRLNNRYTDRLVNIENR